MVVSKPGINFNSIDMKTILYRLIFLKTMVFSIIFFSACNLKGPEQAADQDVAIYQKVSPRLFQEKMSEEKTNFLLIDVRTAQEFSTGAIENSQNRDLLNGDFERALKEWDPKTPVYVYCQKGGRSSQAAKMLQENGFKKIIELRGGYSTWK